MHFGFKSTGSAAVACQGLHGVVESALHMGMESLMFEFFTGDPFGGSHE
jgi:hypothetical protein